MTPTTRPEIVPGTRIFLTTLLKEDVPLMTAWFNDLETTAYLGMVGTFFRIEQEQEWYDNLARQTDQVVFGIVVRETQRIIGSVSLMHIDHAHGSAELGILIGDKTAWGCGYGSEAVRLMAEYGCFFKNLSSICLWFVAFNERGHRAYRRAGFREVGRWRKSYCIGGERYDRVLMDVTRDELDLSRMSGMVRLLGEHGNAEG
ncbi:MAG TPA: GNAT family protein [Herpetosiphonaceae bacterium]